VNIENIREKVREGKYVVAFTHTEKLRSRRIEAGDIEQAIKGGTIIEEYPSDPRGASCLILGLVGNRRLHVLCGRLEAEEVLIITAYEPDPEEWEADWRTRKAR
jgi:hypothetical protein